MLGTDRWPEISRRASWRSSPSSVMRWLEALFFLWIHEAFGKSKHTSVVQLDDFVVSLGLVEGSLGGLAVGAPRLGEDNCVF